MPKKKTHDRQDGSSLIIEYNLHDLPTAQHKAGLAGLVLMLRSMEMRELSPIPKILELTPSTLKLEVTEKSLQTLFDDLYDAEWVEEPLKKKANKADSTLPEEDDDNAEEGENGGTEKGIKVSPKGKFWEPLLPQDNAVWVELWRDMLWQTLRGKDRQRNDYKKRANGNAYSKNPWNDLKNAIEARSKNKLVTGKKIAGTLFVGAQEHNAEYIDFQGTIHHNLLLHFWTLACRVYCPSTIDIKNGTLSYEGFVLVIPEPAALDAFLEEMADAWRTIETRIVKYRPAAAQIDVPEEGGLDFLYSLAHAKVRQCPVTDLVAAIEFCFLKRKGNNINMKDYGRIIPTQNIVEQYEEIRNRVFNPLFKAVRLRNVLSGTSWFGGMDDAFSSFPREFFVSTDKTPRKLYFFGIDVQREFRQIENRCQALAAMKGGEDIMKENFDEILARRVYVLIRSYVQCRTKERSGCKDDDFKNNKNEKGQIIYPPDYREAREKVCSDAFLAMRGRTDNDFVTYFAGTICSIPQFLREEDYVLVTQALMTNWEMVKTLSMLALSAHSYLSQPD